MMYKSLSLFLLSLPILHQGCEKGLKGSNSSQSASEVDSTTKAPTEAPVKDPENNEPEAPVNNESNDEPEAPVNNESNDEPEAPVTTCTYSGKRNQYTFDYVPGGDNVHEITGELCGWKDAETGIWTNKASDYFLTCNEQGGKMKSSGCYISCDWGDDWAIGHNLNPVEWAKRIDGDAFRAQMQGFCRDRFGFSNPEVRDVTIFDEVFDCTYTQIAWWLSKQCVANEDDLLAIDITRFDQEMQDPKKYQDMNNLCLSQGKKSVVSSVTLEVETDDKMEWLKAQCVQGEWLTWIVEFPATRPNGESFLMKVQTEQLTYPRIYNVNGVQDLTCAKETVKTELRAPNDSMLSWNPNLPHDEATDFCGIASIF